MKFCYICRFKYPKNVEEHSPSYDSCEHCEEPTCSKHGRDIDGSRFYCIRCLQKLGLRS